MIGYTISNKCKSYLDIWKLLTFWNKRIFLKLFTIRNGGSRSSSTKTSLDSIWYGRRPRQNTSLKSPGRLPWSRLEEDFFEVVWKTSWKSSIALYFRRLPRWLPIGFPKSDPDLKTCLSNPDLKNLHIISKNVQMT